VTPCFLVAETFPFFDGNNNKAAMTDTTGATSPDYQPLANNTTASSTTSDNTTAASAPTTTTAQQQPMMYAPPAYGQQVMYQPMTYGQPVAFSGQPMYIMPVSGTNTNPSAPPPTYMAAMPYNPQAAVVTQAVAYQPQDNTTSGKGTYVQQQQRQQPVLQQQPIMAVQAQPAVIMPMQRGYPCQQCGTLYPLPQGALSFRCKNCGLFQNVGGYDGCCVIL